MTKRIKKTNAMRKLDQASIPYEQRDYMYDDAHLSGKDVVKSTGIPSHFIFKTIVVASPNKNYVFVVPVLEELDLKQCAKITGEKKMVLLPLDQLEHLTGYIRGGCSPIGMRTLLPTYIDEQVLHLDKLYVSGGKRGVQIGLSPQDLIRITHAQVAKISRESGVS